MQIREAHFSPMLVRRQPRHRKFKTRVHRTRISTISHKWIKTITLLQKITVSVDSLTTGMVLLFRRVLKVPIKEWVKVIQLLILNYNSSSQQTRRLPRNRALHLGSGRICRNSESVKRVILQSTRLTIRITRPTSGRPSKFGKTQR